MYNRSFSITYGDRSSKRLSAIHILINVLGTIIFVILAKLIPLVSFIESLTPNYMMQIAYMHTFFNIISTIIIMTSNKGTAKNTLGFKKNNHSSKVKNFFSDELLSRIDEIINFKNLTKMDLKKIIRKNCPHEVKEEDIELILKEYDMKLQGRGIVKAANKYFQNKAKAQS